GRGRGGGGVGGGGGGWGGGGGGIRGRAAAANDAGEVLRSGAFPQMVLALHESDVAQHPHPQASWTVLLLYYQLTVRYSKILSSGPAHLVPKVMEAICGSQGLGNPNPMLCSRSCYFLTKLVKALKEDAVNYVSVIVPGVQDMISSKGNASNTLSSEAILNLAETVGYLIGLENVPDPQKVMYLDSVLSEQFSKVSAILQQVSASGVPSTPMGIRDQHLAGTELAASVGTMASISKGFKSIVGPELEARFFKALEAATSALLVFQGHTSLRAKTIFLIHGLIPCLGEGVLRGLPQAALLTLVGAGDGKDIMEVVQLLNQLTIEFGPKAASLLDGVLLPFIKRTFELMPSTSNGATSGVGEAGSGVSKQRGTLEAAEKGSSALPEAGIPTGEQAVLGGGGGPAGVAPGQLLAHEVVER
ncbi:unnamed protein product, partial [Choristocarpus tenellus]